MGRGLGREGGAGAAEGATRPEWKRTSDTSPEFASEKRVSTAFGGIEYVTRAITMMKAGAM